MSIFLVLEILFVWSFVGLVRNSRVHRERMRILTEISQVAMADIDAGCFDWYWRYVMFESCPSHGRMVMEMWKPVRSYRAAFEDCVR